MAEITSKNKVTMAKNGAVPLPEHIRQEAGLQSGDELIVIWLPPDTILVRKMSEAVADDKTFTMLMGEFDHALHNAGYETNEDVVNLVREIKAAQATEWDEKS